MIEPQDPARLVEAFLRGGHAAEVSPGGAPRLVGAHPLADQPLGFEGEVGVNFVSEVLGRASFEHLRVILAGARLRTFGSRAC